MDHQNDHSRATESGQTRRGHPRGIYTLFFTEMWERFSYYGMRALLVLFMVDAVRSGGMGMTDEVATAIYGLYTAAAYLAALPGGWVADRILGAQRSVWYGGIVIALGHFTLAIPRVEAFYVGLMLVVTGTGLLKPNVSAIVGQLYPEGGARRDAGFTIFYMGINLGAALGPLVCSTLGEKFNWHYGFGAAGVGMVLGLIQYRLTAKHLEGAGLAPGHPGGARTRDRMALACGAIVVAVLMLLVGAGVVRIGSPLLLADDIKDYSGLVAKLRQPTNPFAASISEALSPETQQLLTQPSGESGVEPDLRAALVNDLNRMLDGHEIVREPVGLTTNLTEQTRHQLLRVNRFSLEDAFPTEIPRTPTINPLILARNTTTVIVVIAVLYFLSVFFFYGLDRTEKKRVGVIVVLFIGAAMFWSGFEQAGSSLNLFAERYTRRGFFGFEIPAGWFQSLNPVYIITLAPVVAALWVSLARRNLNPSVPVKFAVGLVLLGAGFLAMAGAAALVVAGDEVLPTWLILTYLLHSVGELCLSPVGLSSVTKLSPPRLVGQMMGTWFLAASLGNLIAGLIAGEFNAEAVNEMPARYLQIVLTTVGTGVLLWVFARPIKRLMAGVQ